jgi:hypothetical protein
MIGDKYIGLRKAGFTVSLPTAFSQSGRRNCDRERNGHSAHGIDPELFCRRADDQRGGVSEFRRTLHERESDIRRE